MSRSNWKNGDILIDKNFKILACFKEYNNDGVTFKTHYTLNAIFNYYWAVNKCISEKRYWGNLLQRQRYIKATQKDIVNCINRCSKYKNIYTINELLIKSSDYES